MAIYARYLHICYALRCIAFPNPVIVVGWFSKFILHCIQHILMSLFEKFQRARLNNKAELKIMITFKKSAALDLFWPAMHAVQIVLHCFYTRDNDTMYVVTSCRQSACTSPTECPLILHSSLYFLQLDAWDLLLWTQFSPQMLQTFRQQYSSIYLPNGANYFFLCSVDLE